MEQYSIHLLRSSIRATNKLKKMLIQQLNVIKKSLIGFVRKPKR